MLPDLDGIRLKLQRAYEQIEALDRKIDAFMDRRPYKPSFNYDSVLSISGYVTDITIRMIVSEPCPPMWSILIGETLHDIRSALDHLVYQLVIYATGTAPPDKSKTQFPIFDVIGKFNNKEGRKMLNGVSPKAASLIKSFQPFSTGEGIDSPLWRLNQLSNIDKHRAIHLTGGCLEALEVLFPPVSNRAVLSKTSRPPGPFEHDTVVGTARILSEGPLYEGHQVQVDSKATFNIVFDERTRTVAGRPVIESLKGIADRASDCIVSIARDALSINFSV